MQHLSHPTLLGKDNTRQVNAGAMNATMRGYDPAYTMATCQQNSILVVYLHIYPQLILIRFSCFEPEPQNFCCFCWKAHVAKQEEVYKAGLWVLTRAERNLLIAVSLKNSEYCCIIIHGMIKLEITLQSAFSVSLPLSQTHSTLRVSLTVAVFT